MQTALLPSTAGDCQTVPGTITPSLPQQRFAFIEGMRAVAALVVIWNHVFAEVFDSIKEPPPASLNFLGYLMILGHLSVTNFIVLSGFCLMLPLVKTEEIKQPDTVGFFKRRAWRILPPYYFALILCLIFAFAFRNYPMGIHYDSVTGIRMSDIAAHLLLIQNVFGTGKINYVFWSIATEWQLYFLFPVLVALFRTRGIVQTTVITLAIGFVLYVLVQDTRLSRMNIHYMGFFALGMMAARIALSNTEKWRYLQNPAILRTLILFNWAVVALLLVNLGWHNAQPQFVIYDIFVAVATFATLILCTRGWGLLRQLLSWKPLDAIGTFSYSVYLMHVPIIAILLGMVLRPLGIGRINEFWILSIAGTALAVLCCYLFFYLFERPFVRIPNREQTDIGVKSRAVSS